MQKTNTHLPIAGHERFLVAHALPSGEAYRFARRFAVVLEEVRWLEKGLRRLRLPIMLLRSKILRCPQCIMYRSNGSHDGS
jgi:hypothetical protein